MTSGLEACSVATGSSGAGTGSTAESLTAADSSAPRPQPPKEAIDACKPLTEGAACSVKLGDRSIDGTCKKGPDGQGDLACVPAKPPMGPPHGPPPKAVDACKPLTEGAACSVSIHDKTIDGTCKKGPDGQGPLACVPANMPPMGPHDGPRMGPPPEALDACKSLAEGAACSVSIHDKTIDGTCKKGPDGQGPLACVPAGKLPPPPAGP
jgi:hypothetical protein